MNGLAIMVCRNGRELSRACLRSLQRQTFPLDTLVVDNASSDGTAQWLKSARAKDSQVHTMSFAQPQSVATLWNRALEWGWKRGHEKILVVNNDTELLGETFDMLDCAFGSYGMVTSVSRRPGESLDYDRKYLGFRPHPDFSCFMIHRRVFDKIGGFDEGMVGAYYEDNDMHVRMHRAGLKAVCIDLPFIHHGAGTINNAGPEEVNRIQMNAARNKLRFFQKYGCYPGTEGYKKLFL